VIRGALEREINHEPDKSADHSGANVIINLCVYVLVCVCVRVCLHRCRNDLQHLKSVSNSKHTNTWDRQIWVWPPAAHTLQWNRRNLFTHATEKPQTQHILPRFMNSHICSKNGMLQAVWIDFIRERERGASWTHTKL